VRMQVCVGACVSVCLHVQHWCALLCFHAHANARVAVLVQICVHEVAQHCFRFKSGLPRPSEGPRSCFIHMHTAHGGPSSRRTSAWWVLRPPWPLEGPARSDLKRKRKCAISRKNACMCESMRHAPVCAHMHACMHPFMREHMQGREHFRNNQ
jgi:hypothetical protein